MSEVGWVHFVFCFVAIGAGAVVVGLVKGTRWHRTWGHLYVMSMTGIIVSSLLLYERTGSFGPFHVAAIVATVTLAGGLYSVLGRRPRRSWMEAHAIWMSWSYIGLIAALFAETLTRFVMPLAISFLEARSLVGAFWGLVGFATFAVAGIGARLVKTRLPVALERTAHTRRRERQQLSGVEAEEGLEA